MVGEDDDALSLVVGEDDDALRLVVGEDERNDEVPCSERTLYDNGGK